MGGKKVLFILPPDSSLPSRYVRALCLSGYEPAGWEFLYLDRASFSFTGLRFFARMRETLCFVILSLFVRIRHRPQGVVVVKPNSCIHVYALRLIFGVRVVVDINDPMHLDLYLGRGKFKRLLLAANAVIFESEEYSRLISRWLKCEYAVIEDTPQQDTVVSPESFPRQNVLVWFGSPATSEVLYQQREALKKIQALGVSINLLGLGKEVECALINDGLEFQSVRSYDRDVLVKFCREAKFCIVPSPATDEYKLRGNLKAKIGMAMGCVVIASDLRMHRRLIVDGVNGYLYDSNETLFSIVQELLHDAALAERIGMQGSRDIISKFHRGVHAKCIADLFQK